MDEKKEEKGFTVKDRRIFSPESQEHLKEDKEKSEAAPGKPEKQDSARPEETAKTKKTEAETRLPEINFSTFIFSLNSSALVHLGIIEDPASGRKEKNLSFAKQTIDILGMLEEKTKGNLTTDEENFIKNILHDLRLMYVKEVA